MPVLFGAGAAVWEAVCALTDALTEVPWTIVGGQTVYLLDFEPTVPSPGGHALGGRRQMELSPRMKNILDDAASEAERFGSPAVGTEHVLLALIHDGDGVAAQILRRLGVAGAVETDIENQRPSGEDAFSGHPRPWSSV